MKQYCRYCAFCFEGDCYFCSAKGVVLNNIRCANKCKDYAYSSLGDVVSGKQYHPREKKEKRYDEQLKLF